jgi:glycosyltransferase involved in cell wall biosynthesis
VPIGLITGEYPPMQGGVGAFSRELAAALAQQGHSVYVLTDRRAKDSSEPGITVSGTVNGWNRASLFTLRNWVRANQLDVVNIQYEAAAYQMAQLVHLLPHLITTSPVVTTFHDLLVPYLFPKAGPLRYQAVLALARGSNGVIVTNPQDEQQLRQARIACLRQIPIGSNIRAQLPEDYDRLAWRKQLNIPDDTMLIGYFGFMNASKGVDTLLKGAATAVRQGVNAHILLIGGRTGSSDPTNAAFAAQIDQLIAQLDLGSRVHWTGFVDDRQVSAYLSACDMVALPFNDGVSFRRGSFMAALAHGCPIITTTPQVDLPEIQDRENVRLIAPGSPEALAAAIRELANDSTARQRLGTNARILAQRFTWDNIAAQTVAFFREIIT